MMGLSSARSQESNACSQAHHAKSRLSLRSMQGRSSLTPGTVAVAITITITVARDRGWFGSMKKEEMPKKEEQAVIKVKAKAKAEDTPEKEDSEETKGWSFGKRGRKGRRPVIVAVAKPETD